MKKKRRPEPFFRPARGLWYIQIAGKQFNLGPDKALAKHQADQLLKQHYRPKVPSGSVVALLDQFLAWCKQNTAADTFHWYFWRLNSFKDSLESATLPAAEVGPRHLDAWLTGHADWGRTMRHGCIRAVQRAFRWAVKHRLLAHSPVADYEKPTPQKRKVVIPPAEFATILRNIPRPEFRDLLTVSWETACRPQESLAVEARHVDLEHCRWVFPPDESKGEEIARVVYLTPVAAAITRKLMARHPTGPLFRNSQGRPWQTDSVHCAFERLEKKVGKKYCLYHFRHSWLDRALKAGVDSLTCAVVMGHQDASTISRVYQHLCQSPAYLLDAVNRASPTGT
jgi:integrase